MTEYAALRSLIAQVRRRWGTQVILRTIGIATFVAAVPVLIAAGIERLFAPDELALFFLVAVAVLASVALAATAFFRMQRRPADRQVARFIEERAARVPGVAPLDDTLVSAVDLGASPDQPGARAFLPLVAAAAIRKLQAVDADLVVPRQAIRRAAAQAGGGVVLLTAALVLGLPSVIRAFETGRARFFPESIRVDVVPGDARVPAGTPLRIRATVRGASGTLTRLTPSLLVAADGDVTTVAMTPAGDAYEFAFESIDRSFKYSVAAGSARSSEHTVTALIAPRVHRIDLHYTYPLFTGMAPRDEEDGGDIYAPAGTRVRLRVHTDRPAAAGELALDRSTGVALRRFAEQTLEGELVLRADGSYRVTLRDADGLASDGDTEYFIRLMDDRPPDVRILRPSADQQITPLEEVAIDARADDDHGISLFELVYSVSGGPERRVPFARVTGTEVQKIGSSLIEAEDLGVKPGDVITYYARARDVGRGKPPTETRSDLFFLEVKPFNEEFVAAQSQAGGGGGGDAQLESVIAAQKEIISATWNIERRSQGGRSAADVKAIAEAQAALKARVEQMTSRPRGRGRAPAPERPAPEPEPQSRGSSGDPIGQAAEAMAKAQAELEGQRTKEAIPHQMAALNGLLQAQAEVRRRQVSQQSAASGSGGSNRSGQDLSALFDRELQRQQRTNYENRSQIEDRPDRRESNDETLDRIRDLARRQEDLSRRERELANAGLSPEEIKRRLERLTREQSELRQEAEDLARKSGQQSASGGRMRDVTEQMRNAAGDLQRENPSGAAESGRRASEQLRRLEQQMRSGSAGAQGRAHAELQLEAQQVAQEQRRIASEAERLEQAQGSAADEARRRLASEKERLADRVDELQRRALQLSAGKGSPKGKDAAAGEAARSLERERVADRMRESAKDMRSGKPGVEGERQMARTLDKLNEQLGGTQSADARQLADELEQTRAIRDRLNKLEQQIRDAEARERARADRTPRGSAGEPRGAGSSESRGATGRESRAGQTGARGKDGQGGGGQGQGSEDLQRLRQEYQRELQRAREALGRLQAGQPRDGTGNATPEEHEFSRSAPGTEAFKQDRSGWESLRRDVDQALERYEAGASRRLAGKDAQARLSAGGSERVPDRYRDPIAKYFESLASKQSTVGGQPSTAGARQSTRGGQTPVKK